MHSRCRCDEWKTEEEGARKCSFWSRIALRGRPASARLLELTTREPLRIAAAEGFDARPRRGGFFLGDCHADQLSDAPHRALQSRRRRLRRSQRLQHDADRRGSTGGGVG